MRTIVRSIASAGVAPAAVVAIITTSAARDWRRDDALVLRDNPSGTKSSRTASWWERFRRRRDRAALDRAEVEQRESFRERQFADESVEDLAADEVVRERLGGIDPGRLIDDGSIRRSTRQR